MSSRLVLQQPSRKNPVMGFIEQSSSRSPRTFLGACGRPVRSLCHPSAPPTSGLPPRFLYPQPPAADSGRRRLSSAGRRAFRGEPILHRDRNRQGRPEILPARLFRRPPEAVQEEADLLAVLQRPGARGQFTRRRCRSDQAITAATATPADTASTVGIAFMAAKEGASRELI